MDAFKVSSAHELLRKILDSLAASVSGLEVPGNNETSSTEIAAIIKTISKCSQLVDQVEPKSEPQRFGNTSYREWWSGLEPIYDDVMAPLGLSTELKHYFINSFGTPSRIDYGTGHELNFMAWFGGLLLTDHVKKTKGEDILRVFSNYYDLCRKVIRRYNLEPAGSHGVWGLDDHFHIVYILGASQLTPTSMDQGQEVTPASVLDRKFVKEHCRTNLYFGAINFIYEVKRGQFFEHSPILYDISGVASWSKIRTGMIKMYEAEVFSKFPVMQHFWFGSIYKLK